MVQTSLPQSVVCPAPIFMNLVNAQHYYVQISNPEFHTQWKLKVENMDRNSSTTLCEVWLSLL
jgi:hypothetical protein